MAKRKRAAGLIARWYREAGLVLVALIYFGSYLTAKDQFWAGRATVFAMVVLFAVAGLDLVMKNGVEKS